MQSDHAVDSLESMEQKQQNNNVKIQGYSRLLNRGFYFLRFPSVIEREYIMHRNTTYATSNRVTLLIGMFFYLMFGFSDHWLAYQHPPELAESVFIQMFAPRLLITIAFSAFLLGTAYIRIFDRWLYHFSAGGFVVISFSIIYYIHMLQEPYRFLYFLGFLPVQLYAIIAMRQSFRSVTVISASMFIGFLIYLSIFPATAENPDIRKLIDIVLMPYIYYWAVMVVMSLYIVYTAEYAVRKEYLQGQIVLLESDNMQMMRDQMQQQAITDPLTQLYNRRYFEQVLDKEWRKAIRHQDSISMMLIDVDHFKNYNDFYGHQAGDKCLQIVAKTISKCSQRAEDLAVRYGGEEFILLFPSFDKQQACHLAEKIRESIAHLALPHEESDYGIVTISLGVVSTVPQQKDSAEHLIKLADHLLYKAKQEGRNKAVCATGDEN